MKPYLRSRMMRYFFEQIPILPISYIQHRNPMGRNRAINKYTVQGRKLIHKNKESVSECQLLYLRDHPIYGMRGTVELNDNRLSLFVAQKGKYGVSGVELNLEEMHCHHKLPWEISKDESYSNLILVTPEVHRLIHSKKTEIVLYYLEKLQLNEERMARLNKL
ncbi:HNH endonuclease signature motif containing protein [Lactococcus petauri]|uniref:HNH endonuclease signature motif containing protein n=1 Tax=Lactococcus petauri TaxID=1940789 RepID=UPI00385340C1